MNCSKRHLQYFSSTLFFLLIASLSFGQSNPTKTNEHSSITLKTLRGLFPQYPVAIANEIHGGLHVVNTVADLHGLDNAGDLKLDPHVLQKGMLVFLPNPDPSSDVTYSMYYIYVGTVTDGVGSNGTGANLDPNGVNLDNWQPFTDLISSDQLFENVTVINGTSKAIPSGTADGVIPGDHLIIMPSGETIPLAVYVWDDDNSATNDGTGTAEWRLISIGTQVIENTNWEIKEDGDVYEGDTKVTQVFNEGDIIKTKNNVSYVYDGDSWVQITNTSLTDDDRAILVTDADLSKDPSENGHAVGSYNEGDIIKLVNGKDFVAYVLNADGEWMEISRGLVNSDMIEFPVFVGTYDDSSVSTSESANNKSISLDAFRNKINTSSSIGLSITGANTGVVIEYPAAWGNLSYSIVDSGNTFELTNGINITVVEKTIGSVTVDYKQITIPCETSTIVVN